MNSDGQEAMITEEETDILQEIMNIAFGRAASDLAEYIDIFVILSVPYIKLLRSADLPSYISDEIKDFSKVSLDEQNFWGKFEGSALLVFPADSGKRILSLLDGSDEYLESDPNNELEKEAFPEVGNSLIGACIGKIAELLGDVITYSPPRVVVEKSQRNIIADSLFVEDNLAIVLRAQVVAGHTGSDLLKISAGIVVGLLLGLLAGALVQHGIRLLVRTFPGK